jgi:hypothetical protein
VGALAGVSNRADSFSENARDRHRVKCSRSGRGFRITYWRCAVLNRSKLGDRGHDGGSDASQEMNQVFSNRTMWQSFVCALVATFTLAVSCTREAQLRI